MSLHLVSHPSSLHDLLNRFATSKYREPSDYNTSNMFMHLTNYSINKNSRMYSTDDEVGTKRKISTLNRILANEGYDVAELWSNIDDVIIKTVLSALPMLKHNYNASFPSHDMIQACFEILGMDILIDSKMKPFILEVNHSPSFHTSEQVDKEVKEALIRDTLLILNLTQDIRKKVSNIYLCATLTNFCVSKGARGRSSSHPRSSFTAHQGHKRHEQQ